MGWAGLELCYAIWERVAGWIATIGHESMKATRIIRRVNGLTTLLVHVRRLYMVCVGRSQGLCDSGIMQKLHNQLEGTISRPSLSPIHISLCNGKKGPNVSARTEIFSASTT